MARVKRSDNWHYVNEELANAQQRRSDSDLPPSHYSSPESMRKQPSRLKQRR